ncbi:hypothetical protein SFC43_25870 [Bacteroides sp. CR5/BHMF/2]|nr:hypothetical protein [Bacteroides sp. CR5/BHMF/2]
MLQKMVKERHDYIAKTNGKRSFPGEYSPFLKMTKNYWITTWYFYWQAVSLTDLSWIKPGKVAWDWWNDWNLSGVDFRAESTMIRINTTLTLPLKTILNMLSWTKDGQ